MNGAQPNPTAAKYIWGIVKSPDILNECAPPWDSIHIDYHIGIPYNLRGYQWARTGTKMIAFVYSFAPSNPNLLNDNIYREVVSFRIRENLESNKKYCLKYYVNLSNNSWFATDAMDAGFSADSSLFTPDSIRYITKTTNRGKGFLTDTLNWMKISDTIIATGNEKYIHIGRIDKINQNNIIMIRDTFQYTLLPYHLDDISLCKCDTVPPAADAGQDKIICKGDSVLIGTHNYADYFYSWWENGQQIQRDKQQGQIWVKPQQSSWYVLQSTDFKYDKTKDSVFVKVINCKAAINDTSICFGDEVNIGKTAIPNATYEWFPKTYLDNAFIANPKANPDQSIMYYVDVEDSSGFKFSDSVHLNIIFCDSTDIEVPNVFTPNNDGFNDVFTYKNQEQFDINLEIYNRWGNLLFKSLNENWDGKHKGEKVSPGVYFYVIRAKSKASGVEIMKSGSVSVLY
jgi:gliding motility-associated-like protein